MQSSLESFVLRFVEHAGGVAEAVEPQVYDVLAPEPLDRELGARIVFDPEALADYPSAQLLAFGNPALDALFALAQADKRAARVYVRGLNVNPHNVQSLAAQSLTLAPGVTLRVSAHRPLHYAHALFWFQATFVSDEKTQRTFHAGVDLHYKRSARHLDRLVREHGDDLLADDAPIAYPEAPALTLEAGYALALEEALAAITIAAHERLNDLQRALGLETRRIDTYFDDMRAELDARAERADDAEAGARFAAQRAALDREQAGQLADLRRKMALAIDVKLINLLTIWQPKIRIDAALRDGKTESAPFVLTYDPLQKRLDAPACPNCGRSTFALRYTKQGRLHCADCH
jgi:ribosomal protein S27AE